MADIAGVSPSNIGRVWRAQGITPPARPVNVGRTLVDVVALYLDQPVKAIVFSIDKDTRVPALDPSTPAPPPKRGGASVPHYDRPRRILLAALTCAACALPSGILVWSRGPEFLGFLRNVESSVDAGNDIHVLVENYARYKHPAMDRWLERRPCVRLVPVPANSSWTEAIERLLGDLTDKGLRRGSLGSVSALVATIKGYVATYERTRPFVWTKASAR